MRITIVTNSLSGGGAERTAVNLSGVLAQRGHEVTLVCRFEAKEEYQLPEGVDRFFFPADPVGHGLMGRFRAILRRNRNIRSTILASKPDVVAVFTSKWSVRVLLALWSTRIPVVVSERNNPSKKRLSLAWNLLRRVAYRKSACLVSLSHCIDHYFTWLPMQQRAVIYNPLPPLNLSSETGDPLPKLRSKRVIAMGRLVHQKGFDLLLAAFRALSVNHGDWELVILGEGPERTKLEKMVLLWNLEETVRLPGRIVPPFATLKNSELFVFSSRYEGLGNSLIEAMACGVPVVSFDCPCGPSELIQQCHNGILAPPEDVAALTSAMKLLMRDKQLCRRLVLNATHDLLRFGPHRIAAQWEEVFRRALQY